MGRLQMFQWIATPNLLIWVDPNVPMIATPNLLIWEDSKCSNALLHLIFLYEKTPNVPMHCYT